MNESKVTVAVTWITIRQRYSGRENVEADRFKAQVERLLQRDGRGKEGRGGEPAALSHGEILGVQNNLSMI